VKGNLVVGASGLVGSHLMQQLRAQGKDATGTYLGRFDPGLRFLDFCDQAASAALLKEVSPAVVYFPAANPNVEWAEQYPDEARRTNVTGAQALLKLAQDAGAKIVYYSSEYVFDGAHGPYREDDTPNPISVYGRLKLEMEEFILKQMPEALILRTTVVYGWEQQPKNYVQRLVASLRAGETEVRAPTDQISSPTFAVNLARASIELAAGHSGIFHVAGDARCSRYEFALAVADTFALRSDSITGVSTASLGQLAPRPLNAGLLVEKAKSVMSAPLRPYQEGLVGMRALEPSIVFTDGDPMRAI
jgi:dTDP-4-dehydrorhamnose reductase